MALSLRQKQLDAVVRMLNLNHPVTSGGTADEEVYKVLILDRYCRDILSPLIRVNDLRKHGITLYLMIDNERQNIPDVPAIYFIQPTTANIQRITLDASRGVYESFHLNFASSLPRALLEELAGGTLKADCLHRIAKVYDQYLEFVTLENGLFTLSQPLTYLQLNDPSAQEKDVISVVDGIVNGLFSVLATLGVVPVIRCARGGPAEMVATLLDTRLRDHLVSRNNLFTEAGHIGSSFQRPVLCLFDRNFELSAAVQHVWSYRPLVHDVLGMKLNRVSVQAEPGAPVLKKVGGKSYELDDSDPFWVANGGAPFPKVAEEVQIQLDKYKLDVEEVNRRTGGGREEDFDDQELLGNTKHLMSAVNSLPELTERKRTIDKHTNIATALLGEIKSRHLDNFCSSEEDMLTNGRVDKSAVITALKGKGTSTDKLRLAIVFLLATETTVPSEVEAVEAALREADIDLAPFFYVKRHKSLTFSVSASASASQPASRSQFADWSEKFYGQAISAVTAGVKNLLSGGRQLAVTRAVESLMDAKLASDTESYLLFDPRGPKSMGAGGQSKGPFKEAIVFMIGGGNYLEYSSLQELAQRQQPAKNIIYGTTEILSGQEFVDQLAELGMKMGGGGGMTGLT
ncbi:unnamed protein product [Calypogeia fissa]